MKKIEHIDAYEVQFYPALMERLCIEGDPKSSDFDVETELSDCWYDCDYVKLNGEHGRGDHCFITVTEGDTTYVIHENDAEDSEAVEIINWFLNGHNGDLIDGERLQNTWDDWNKVQTGVAYRGGSGYCYALYAKSLKPINQVATV